MMALNEAVFGRNKKSLGYFLALKYDNIIIYCFVLIS